MNSLSYRLSFLLAITMSGFSFGQQKDTTVVTKLGEVNIYKDKNAYKRELERVRKIYPYALHAAELLDKFDEEMGQINSKRKKKKYSKKAHKVLKTDYNYVIRDLYRSEGILLMKLIHRETGMTASEIIKKYRGKFSSELYEQLGKLWDQNLEVKYDPLGADKLTESIILEIENEMVAFDNEAKMVTKEDYKAHMKIYRSEKKEYKQLRKAQKHAGGSKI